MQKSLDEFSLEGADVIVDVHEASGAKRLLEGLKKVGLRVKIEPLPADYLVLSDGSKMPCLIERKTVTDLVNTLRSKRLFDQLEILKSVENVVPLLLVEGSPHILVKYRRWSRESVVGLLASLLYDWNIHIAFMPSRQYTVLFLKTLANRLGKPREKKAIALRPSVSRELTPREKAIYVLEGFPLVSAERARMILKHFKSIRGFVNNLSELEKVKGIGKTIRKEVEAVVNYEWEEG
jgi:ERCC4-type nuclease